MKFLVVATFLFSLSLVAQDKISNNDLRHLNKIISVTFNSSNSLTFFKSKLDQYYLQSFLKNKNVSIKIANSEFKKIDDLFVQKFINMKYMMSTKPKDCKESHSLFMRGESLNVCKTETKKIEIVNDLISLIQKIK